MSLVPKACRVQGPYCKISHVKDMDIYQTAIWVWTYCYHQGWADGKAYAEKFMEYGITGSDLRHVDRDIMECNLGIKNNEHRAQLMVAIDSLFPNKLLTQFCEGTILSPAAQIYDGQTMFWQWVSSSSGLFTPYRESDSQSQRAFSGFHTSPLATNMDESVETDSLSIYSFSDHSSQSMTVDSSTSNTFPSSFNNPSLNDETSKAREPNGKTILTASTEEGCAQKKKFRRYRKLVATLSADEEVRRTELNRISELLGDDKVKVKDMKKPWAKTLIFRDYETALKAEKMLSQESFKIAMKYFQRARPKNPVEYVTLTRLDVRRGKSLSQPIVGTVEKNTLVKVTQSKGREARLEHPEGWVSMYTTDIGRPDALGKPQLARKSEYTILSRNFLENILECNVDS